MKLEDINEENIDEELTEQNEKQEKKGKLSKKKRLIIILSSVCVLLLAGGTAFFFYAKNRNDSGRRDMPFSMDNMGENVISASGLTSVGMLSELWELDFLETSIYVEESYLSTGDEVEAGTAVFKVSEDTLEDARKELENAVVEAELAYRQGVIDYETGVIDARVTNETAAVNKKYSQAEYDKAVAEAAKQVERLEEQVEEARELAEEYTKSVNEDYYRTYYKVDELYQAYCEHFALLMEYYEKWNIEESEGTSGGSGSSSGGNSSSGTGSSSGGSQTGGGSNLRTMANGSVSAENAVLNTNMTAVSDLQFLTMSLNTLAESGESGDGTGGSGDGTDESGDGNGGGGDGTDGSGDGTDGSGNDNSGNGNTERPGGANGAPPQMDQGGGGQGNMGETSGAGRGSSYNEASSILSVYNMLDELVQEESNNYETALKNYETAKKRAAAGLEQAISNLESLEAELVQAQTQYEKQLISCKADYEITIAESDNAQAVYETALESLEETLAALADDKEEAEENMALFEETIGDGYFYTQNAGTIVMNGVRANSYLSGESLVIAYSNPETVTVTASVDQSNIADISIGDSVYVTVSEYGSYQGTVTLINPVTQAQSRSSVTYQVTVMLDGDVSTLDSNLTAYVYFGMSDETIQQMMRMSETGAEGESGERGGGMPEGEDRERGGGRPGKGAKGSDEQRDAKGDGQ